MKNVIYFYLIICKYSSLGCAYMYVELNHRYLYIYIHVYAFCLLRDLGWWIGFLKWCFINKYIFLVVVHYFNKKIQ